MNKTESIHRGSFVIQIRMKQLSLQSVEIEIR